MAVGVFRTMGRLTGYLLKTEAVDRAVSMTTRFALTEMKCADIRLKITLLKRKRERHITLLGKTVYRLALNEQDIVDNDKISMISRVLIEIDIEIDQAVAELARRKNHARKTRR